MANIFHIDRPTNKITLGTTGTTINIASHTASQSLALDASKNLESIDLSTVYQPLDAELTSLATLSYVAASFVKMTGANTFALRTIGETKTDLSLNLVENTTLSTWAGTTNIVTLGTIATGTWQSTDVGIAYGGTGQSTAQLAINALTAVGAATNEHVLTKDTGTGNAIWKAATGDGYVDRGNLGDPDFVAGDLTLDNLWHELDLSGIIPVNTKLVFLRFSVMSTVAPKQIKIATNGSDSGYNNLTCNTQVANVSYGFRVFMYPTADRKIQYLVNAATWISFEITVVGWFV